jgi:hypothetical protein
LGGILLPGRPSDASLGLLATLERKEMKNAALNRIAIALERIAIALEYPNKHAIARLTSDRGMQESHDQQVRDLLHPEEGLDGTDTKAE